MSSVSLSKRLRAKICAKEGSTWCVVHRSSHGCCLSLNWKRWEYIFFLPLIGGQQTTAKGTRSFSTLPCEVGQTQREQVALGIRAMCAHGSVACWGSGKAVSASWAGLCLVGWCIATPRWAECAGLLRAVWDINSAMCQDCENGMLHVQDKWIL